MTLQEKKNRINDFLSELLVALDSRYGNETINGKKVYISGDVFFMPFSISDWMAVGIEYAFGRRDAENQLYEDGDLFYIGSDYEGLIREILKEIEQTGI